MAYYCHTEVHELTDHNHKCVFSSFAPHYPYTAYESRMIAYGRVFCHVLSSKRMCILPPKGLFLRESAIFWSLPPAEVIKGLLVNRYSCSLTCANCFMPSAACALDFDIEKIRDWKEWAQYPLWEKKKSHTFYMWSCIFHWLCESYVIRWKICKYIMPWNQINTWYCGNLIVSLVKKNWSWEIIMCNVMSYMWKINMLNLHMKKMNESCKWITCKQSHVEINDLCGKKITNWNKWVL